MKNKLRLLVTVGVVLVVLGLVFLIFFKHNDENLDNNTNQILQKYEQQQKKTEEIKNEMSFSDGENLSNSYMLGNAGFVTYKKLTFIYGKGDGKDKKIDFNGSDGYVKVTGLQPVTRYEYKVVDEKGVIISKGQFTTLPKK